MYVSQCTIGTIFLWILVLVLDNVSSIFLPIRHTLQKLFFHARINFFLTSVQLQWQLWWHPTSLELDATQCPAAGVSWHASINITSCWVERTDEKGAHQWHTGDTLTSLMSTTEIGLPLVICEMAMCINSPLCQKHCQCKQVVDPERSPEVHQREHVSRDDSPPTTMCCFRLP